jgi:hypothetical protein
MRVAAGFEETRFGVIRIFRKMPQGDLLVDGRG